MKLRPLLAALFALAALPLGRAEAACVMQKVGVLHVRVENNRIFVPGTINGRKIDFMIATDIDSLILPNAAEDMQLPQMLGTRFLPFVYFEEIKIGPTLVHDVTIDGVPARDTLFHILGHRADFGGPDKVAILGRDFLHQFDVEFDLDKHEVSLFKPQNCKGSDEVYWSDSYNALDMTPNRRSIRVPISLNGKRAEADLNTSNPYTAVGIASAYELDVTRTAPGVSRTEDSYDLLANRPIETWLGRFLSLTLDHETIKPAWMRFRALSNAPRSTGIEGRDFGEPETGYARPELDFMAGVWRKGSEAEVSLGVDFMLAHRVLVAYSQDRLYFTYREGAPFLQAPSPTLTDKERQAQVAALAERYQADLKDPAFDIIRDKVSLQEIYRRHEPSCQPGPNDPFPTAAEKTALHKWAATRATYFREVLSVLAPPGNVSEKLGSLIDQYYTAIQTSSTQTGLIIDQLADGKLTYCRFATDHRAALEAAGRNSDAIFREMRKVYGNDVNNLLPWYRGPG